MSHLEATLLHIERNRVQIPQRSIFDKRLPACVGGGRCFMCNWARGFSLSMSTLSKVPHTHVLPLKSHTTDSTSSIVMTATSGTGTPLVKLIVSRDVSVFGASLQAFSFITISIFCKFVSEHILGSLKIVEKVFWRSVNLLVSNIVFVFPAAFGLISKQNHVASNFMFFCVCRVGFSNLLILLCTTPKLLVLKMKTMPTIPIR